MIQKYEILKNVFGHDGFRALQEEAVDAILHQNDVLMILPTGGGKSLCYQLPALMMPGVSIVVSPLLALMHDQVLALKANGLKAAMLSSMQDAQEQELVRYELLQGELDFLYVAPERLVIPSFLMLLKQIKISFFVIDEAHCVSQWGHEFREDYRKLHLLKEQFPHTKIAAFTATATPKVQKDISDALGLHEPVEIRGKIFRDNLHISVQARHKNGRAQLLEFLKNFKDDSGIVYAFSRKQTESLAEFLQDKGIKAKAFHAGLSNTQKEQTFHDFVHDEIQVVVATIAFGMGIDKSNIRFVVHMSLPKSLENYYQEIGRAGRDGLNSEVLLLFSGADMMMQKEFIEQLGDSPYRQMSLNKLEMMSRYADSESCRHQFIAHYFEDELDACAKHCDNCCEEPREKTDITIDAQKLLSCIYRTGQRFGQSYLIDVLRASKVEKIMDNGHDSLSVYGIGSERSKAYWESIMQRLMEIGAVSRGEFRALVIDAVGMQILKKEYDVFITSSRLEKKANQTYTSHIIDEALNTEGFEQLRRLRASIAKEENKPAYIIFGDKTLKQMANELPQDKEQMLGVSGVGEVKYERYGEQFLAACIRLKDEG